MNRSEAKTTFFAWLYNPASIEIQSPEYNRDKALQKYYENGVITTPYGRQMIVEDKKALNYLIQSTTADLVLEKAVQIDELLTNKKSFISHIVHDEIVLDISHDERDLISEIKEVFSNNQLGSYLVNLKVGKNYLNLEDFKV
jgi:DNA polymerase I-like protein with 3'-5' exonuclease and polymerase domains